MTAWLRFLAKTCRVSGPTSIDGPVSFCAVYLTGKLTDSRAHSPRGQYWAGLPLNAYCSSVESGASAE
jgi:hypothetical protein